MEFEDEEREEEEEDEDEEEDDEDEEQPMSLLTPPYKTSDKKIPSGGVARYRECLKNHAVGIGGHAVDGCGEFMPAGPDGTLDALKCAACNCHRNFHRKEHLLLDHHHNQHQLTIFTPRQHHVIHPPHPPPPPPNPQPPQVFQFYPYNRTTASPGSNSTRPLALPSPAATAGDAEERLAGGMMTMTMTSSSGKKRHRTKFSQEQKDKMLELSEKLGWRIQKQDETVVQQFCDETGVKRHVLKVWMHNNKHTLGKKPPALMIDSNVIPDN